MRVKLLPKNSNSNPFSSHFISIYTCRETTTLRVRGDRSIKILIFNICVHLPPRNWWKFNKTCVHVQVFRIGSPFFPDGDGLWVRAFSQKRQNILMEPDMVTHPYSTLGLFSYLRERSKQWAPIAGKQNKNWINKTRC